MHKALTRIATLLATLFVVTGVAPAFAATPCARGDKKVGPNCVHEEKTNTSAHGRVSYTTIYRKGRKVVWEGVGYFVETKGNRIVVDQLVLDKDGSLVWGPVELAWDSSKSQYVDSLGCAEGDDQMGPNCVHTEMVKIGPTREEARSTVYRVSDRGQETVVWKGWGGVTDSTTKKLEVLRWAPTQGGGMDHVTFSYTWEGGSYR